MLTLGAEIAHRLAHADRRGNGAVRRLEGRHHASVTSARSDALLPSPLGQTSPNGQADPSATDVTAGSVVRALMRRRGRRVRRSVPRVVRDRDRSAARRAPARRAHSGCSLNTSATVTAQSSVQLVNRPTATPARPVRPPARRSCRSIRSTLYGGSSIVLEESYRRRRVGRACRGADRGRE